LILCAFCLWANEEKPEDNDHQSKKDELESAETFLPGGLQ
jgi:hypothetical protein